jgi:membrane protein implicated in regulation of membrane protease activity
MIEIPIAEAIYAVAALVGGVLLLITVVFDDILGGVLDGLGFDIGGGTVTPILLGFIGMFGAGGLFATQVLDLHGAQAAIVGVASGVAGAAFAGVLFSLLKRSESEEPFKIGDLVGGEAFVSVAIPANRYGSVLVKAEGQTHEFAATSERDIPAGRTVRVTGVAGTAVIVHDETSAGQQPAGEG